MKSKHVYIIAEAGVNHNGSIATAYEMIEKAKEMGADAVKFQTFCAEDDISKYAAKADYQKESTGAEESQFEMVKKLELPFSAFQELKVKCEGLDIDFLSTPFDIRSIDFLHSIGMKCWKIPSGEVTNLPYLIRVGKLAQRVILSTGMCELEEVGRSIEILREHGTADITVLHCTTEYPAPFDEVNLAAMNRMGEYFHLPIGYSDHTQGIEIPIAAAALGAEVIEKHFTLDRDMPGPDHRASIEPAEFKNMVQAIRNIEQAMGMDEKKPTASELRNRVAARKSIVAKKRIAPGEIFSEENITVKRPGDGISPMEWFSILGMVSDREYLPDEQIEVKKG